jgi:hypothetical protein
MPPPNSGHQYWAFISYSTKDTRVAERLQKRLETYRIPRDLVGRPGRDEPLPRCLFPIFRDRDELPLSSDLSAAIEAALAASRYLIVICSPEAARSQWVNEEIRYFKQLGRADRLLAIIIDGKPNASDDPAATSPECFPPALRYRVDDRGEVSNERTQPAAGDIRADGRSGAFLKAVAGITGLGLDAFARRERKRRRRQRAIAGIAVLMFLLGSLWVWDYNRVKVGYFANTRTRWGAPEGVGALDAKTRRGRQFFSRSRSAATKSAACCGSIAPITSWTTITTSPSNKSSIAAC